MEQELWPLAGQSFSSPDAVDTEDQSVDLDIGKLTARMVRGDEDAYRQFYDAYFPRLLGYLLVVNRGNEDAAREALQLTLLRVVRNIKQFQSPEVFWSWLTVLARSSTVDEQRKRSRHFGLLFRFFQREQVRGSALENRAEERLLELLRQHLTSLPDDDREIVERKYFGGESVREIAESLEVSEKAIESRLARARQKLKQTVLQQLRYES